MTNVGEWDQTFDPVGREPVDRLRRKRGRLVRRRRLNVEIQFQQVGDATDQIIKIVGLRQECVAEGAVAVGLRNLGRMPGDDDDRCRPELPGSQPFGKVSVVRTFGPIERLS